MCDKLWIFEDEIMKSFHVRHSSIPLFSSDDSFQIYNEENKFKTFQFSLSKLSTYWIDKSTIFPCLYVRWRERTKLLLNLYTFPFSLILVLSFHCRFFITRSIYSVNRRTYRVLFPIFHKSVFSHPFKLPILPSIHFESHSNTNEPFVR